MCRCDRSCITVSNASRFDDRGHLATHFACTAAENECLCHCSPLPGPDHCASPASANRRCVRRRSFKAENKRAQEEPTRILGADLFRALPLRRGGHAIPWLASPHCMYVGVHLSTHGGVRQRSHAGCGCFLPRPRIEYSLFRPIKAANPACDSGPHVVCECWCMGRGPTTLLLPKLLFQLYLNLGVFGHSISIFHCLY